MDIRHGLFSFVNISIAVLAAYLLFRKKPRETLVSRGPLFMVCFLLFFAVGVGSLPLALPGLFERLLGHSVWMNYTPPVKMNVTQVGGTWWLVRWSEPVQTGYFCVFLAGIAWAAFNIVQGRARKLNVFCVCVGVLWMLASFAFSFACFPFCF
ncbi:MAG TPA: hypothetical protein VN911_17330 [Candidatus Acidoferrum sp.]|nr:hypothetical protein [Candidatus Acidoferrum sp.]